MHAANPHNDNVSNLHSDLLSHIHPDVTIFWYRRDLRVSDNAGLYYALRENEKVLPVFILDTTILNDLEEKADPRVEFILESLNILNDEFVKFGSSLLVLHGDPVDLFRSISPKAVYTNHDYEPYARERDEKVGEILNAKGIPFRTFKDQVIFDKDEVVKSDGTPYTVFTPYSRQWKNTLTKFYLRPYPADKYLSSLLNVDPFRIPAIEAIGFRSSGIELPPRVIKRKLISNYNKTRDIPAIDGTSRLGVHLRFGTISIRALAGFALKNNETFLKELIWREFYSMILYHFPQVVTSSFKPAYDRIPWRNDEREFHLWCGGNTGYPLVDAGMRELNKTGFMHNRVRMVAASFLTKHLLIDWRWGEAYFAKKLLDYDLASNNGGWQWAAGSGCDAAPYFRIFNPALQSRRFDPSNAYVKKWVPEFGTEKYARPIVEHTSARERALRTYQKALERSG